MIHFCLGGDFLEHDYVLLCVHLPMVRSTPVGWFVIGLSPWGFWWLPFLWWWLWWSSWDYCFLLRGWPRGFCTYQLLLPRFELTQLFICGICYLLFRPPRLKIHLPELLLVWSCGFHGVLWGSVPSKFSITGFPRPSDSIWCRFICTYLFGEWVSMLFCTILFLLHGQLAASSTYTPSSIWSNSTSIGSGGS